MTYLKIPKFEIKECVNRVSQTEGGRVLLALLREQCGFFNNFVDTDNPVNTHVFASIRGVYASIRQYINTENLINIEYRTEFVDKRNKDDGESN